MFEDNEEGIVQVVRHKSHTGPVVERDKDDRR